MSIPIPVGASIGNGKTGEGVIEYWILKWRGLFKLIKTATTQIELINYNYPFPSFVVGDPRICILAFQWQFQVSTKLGQLLFLQSEPARYPVGPTLSFKIFHPK